MLNHEHEEAPAQSGGFSFSGPLEAHAGGKLHTEPAFPLDSVEALSLAYTPGVADVCTAIAADRSLAFTHTIKANTVAVVTDGSAVLGLGDIGPHAAEPVMSGKAMLMREFAGLDAFPICLDTRDVDEIVRTVQLVAPVFGAINLEDISAPRCFEIERRLDALLDIPVFHDDQHGTAVVVSAAILNAVRVTGRELGDLRVVLAGVGAAGVACADMLMALGVRDIVGFDREGAVHAGRAGLAAHKAAFAARTNPRRITGGLGEALRGADVFVGLSGPGLVCRRDIAGMAPAAIVLALANPVPEILPAELAGLDVAVYCTGRSDLPNQANNSLAFPGILRGALDAGARTVNEAMKLAAATAIAGCVTSDELATGQVVPRQLDRRVAPIVAAAVSDAARRSGACRE